MFLFHKPIIKQNASSPSYQGVSIYYFITTFLCLFVTLLQIIDSTQYTPKPQLIPIYFTQPNNIIKLTIQNCLESHARTMKKKSASTIICENFKIPQQTIFQDYKCSFKAGLTYFGRLYIGEEHVCFIANMFGILKKCVIQIEKIQKLIEPVKLSLSIEEKLHDNSTVEYHFSGFKTNHAYTLIRALWKKQKIESQVLNSNDDEETYLMTGENMDINKDKLIDEGNVESSFFNPKAIEADKLRLCEFQLPCSVEQYYNFFLADNATVYSRRKHMELKDAKQIVITPWRKSEELDSEIKEISGLIRVFGVPFLSYAHLSQVWKMRRKENGEIMVDFVTQMGDVPYCNYFVVNNYLEILKEGETKCKMRVDMSIVFNKSTYMKSTILSKTITDMKEDYNFWFGQVKTTLQKMRKSQQAEHSNKSLRGSRATKTSSDIEFESNDVSFAEPLLQNFKHNKLRQGQTSGDKSQSEISRLNLKIDNLTKIMIALLFFVVIQLILNGILISQMSSSSKQSVKDAYKWSVIKQEI